MALGLVLAGGGFQLSAFSPNNQHTAAAVVVVVVVEEQEAAVEGDRHLAKRISSIGKRISSKCSHAGEIIQINRDIEESHRRMF